MLGQQSNYLTESLRTSAKKYHSRVSPPTNFLKQESSRAENDNENAYAYNQNAYANTSSKLPQALNYGGDS